MKKLFLLTLFVFLLTISALFSQRNRVVPYNLSLPCTRNVNCPEGFNYNFDSRNCTVLIAEANATNTVAVRGFATGTLLNYDIADFSPNGTPKFHYLLTSYHVLRYLNLNRWYLVFNYQHKYCKRDSIPPAERFYTVLSPADLDLELMLQSNDTTPDNDWALIKIKNNLENIPDICLCGWNKNPTFYDENGESTTIPTDVACISHPNGDVKKLIRTDYLDIDQYSSNRLKANIIPPNVEFGYWTVNPTVGMAEPGTSGASLIGSTASNNVYCPNCIIGVLNGADTLHTDGDYCKIRDVFFTKMEVFYDSIYVFLNPDTINGQLQSKAQTFFTTTCPFIGTKATCFDNEKNQGEDDTDCCIPRGCKICPPCFPVSNGGGEGEYFCNANISDFDLLGDCFSSPSRVPQVKFRTRADCNDFLRFEWRENGQNTPTGDINPTYQRIHIGGLIYEYTFSWDFHGGTPTFPVSKTYTLYAIDDRTVNTIATAQFPVTIYGPAIVNAGQDLSMCVNQTEQLNGQFQGGNYYANPVWQAIPSNGLNYLSNANVLNPLLTPTQVGTYRYILEVRDAMNCSGFDTLTVTVDTVTRPAVLRLTCVIPPNHYQAGRIYTAETCSTTISSPIPTDFVGAQEVNLLPGFTASGGATFTARIAPCAVEDEPVSLPQGKLGEPQPVSESKPLTENEFEVDVFPNPNDGTFTVRYQSLTDKFISVRIYDNIGRKLIEKNWNDRLYDFEVDLSSYASGVYHVVVSDGEHTLTKKVLKK